MSRTLSVSFMPRATVMARAVVASLGRSLRPVVRGPADIEIIEGTAGWTAHALAALDSGLRRLLVMEPAFDDPTAIRELAERIDKSGASLALSEGISGDPAIAGFRDSLGAGFHMIALRGTHAAAPKEQLLVQLRLLRAIGVADAELADVVVSDHGLLGTGRGRLSAGEVSLQFALACSTVAPRQLELVALGAEAAARIVLFGGANARPAQATQTTAEGMRILPDFYETAHRTQLRLLAGNVLPASAAALRQFGEDVERTQAALA